MHVYKCAHTCSRWGPPACWHRVCIHFVCMCMHVKVRYAYVYVYTSEGMCLCTSLALVPSRIRCAFISACGCTYFHSCVGSIAYFKIKICDKKKMQCTRACTPMSKRDIHCNHGDGECDYDDELDEDVFYDLNVRVTSHNELQHLP
jgi:hypothetical protein